MEIIKNQLIKHLDGGEAFMPVSEMLDKIPFDSINIRPAGLPYSFYQLFYHIVYTQKDIVKFVCSEDYIKPKWPDYYWPKDRNCKNSKIWENLKAEYFTDKERLKNFTLEDVQSLGKVVKNGKDDQTLIREILLVIEHTAYHTGQLLVVLRLLNLH